MVGPNTQAEREERFNWKLHEPGNQEAWRNAAALMSEMFSTEVVDEVPDGESGDTGVTCQTYTAVKTWFIW
jgi:hypothetical protein